MTLKQSRCWSCRTTTSGMKLQNSSVNSSLHPSQTGPGSSDCAQQGPTLEHWGPSRAGSLPAQLPWAELRAGTEQLKGPPLPAHARGLECSWPHSHLGDSTACHPPSTVLPPFAPEKPHRAAQAVAVGSFHPINSSMATWATPKWSQQTQNLCLGGEGLCITQQSLP